MSTSNRKETSPTDIPALELPTDESLGALEPIAFFYGPMPTGITVSPKDSSVGNSSAGMSVDDVSLRLFVDMHYIITTILNTGTWHVMDQLTNIGSKS